MNPPCYAVVVAAACLWLQASLAYCQNTILADPIQTHVSGFWDTTVFATKLHHFALGHQWAAAKHDKTNTRLRANLTNHNWGYTAVPELMAQLTRLGAGVGDTNYLCWGEVAINDHGAGMSDYATALRSRTYGMRWEPAEVSNLTRTYAARDADAWPFGFAARHHGTVPTSTSDANYRRYVVAVDTSLSYPVKILDSAEPRTMLRMYEHGQIVGPFSNGWMNWSRTETIVGPDTSSGRILRLVVNLRRLDAADTVMDDAVVASIVVPYHMHSIDHDPDHPDEWDEFRRLRMPFRRVPVGDAAQAVALPLGRGLELPMEDAVGMHDSIVITRRMLPRHGDPGGPDITIVAEFRTDTIYEYEFGNPLRRKHLLKTRFDGYADHRVPDATLKSSDTAAYNYRYMAIDSLGVTVWHHGVTGIAVRSASLLTPHTHRMTTGHYDSLWAVLMTIHRDTMRERLRAAEALTGRTLRVLAFYGPDEFDIDELVGMRYRLSFFDRRYVSETGYHGDERVYGRYRRGGNALHLFQGFPTRLTWTAGVTMQTQATAAPYAALELPQEWNFNTNQPIPAPALSLKSGLRHGSSNALTAFRDYETAIWSEFHDHGVYKKAAHPVATDSVFSYTSIEAYEHMLHSNRGAVGPLAMHEHAVYVDVYGLGDYLFARRRHFLTNFFYHLNPTIGFDDAMRPYVHYGGFRPLTGEEARLQHGIALCMGSRGFMYDKWYYQPDERFNPHRRPHEVTNNELLALYGESYFPGYITEDSTADVWDTLSTVTPDSMFRSTHLGSDWYGYNDRIGIHNWAHLDTVAKYTGVSRIIKTTSPGTRVYVGRRSVRTEAAWWADLVTDTTTTIKGTWAASARDMFLKLRPVAWSGHGYRLLKMGDQTRLAKWIDTAASKLVLHRRVRASATDTTIVEEVEPQWDRFWDVVLMDTTEADYSDTVCVVAVTNRRTNPLLYNTKLADSVEFITSYDIDNLVRTTRPELRYAQAGARRCTLPLRYSVDNSKPYLLHVRELLPAADAAWRIDTVVGGKTDFTFDLRPGETRFFMLRRLPAADTTGRGFLAFSSQTKLVAAPVLNAAKTAYTDSVRYHMVFHAPDTDTTRTGVWTVFYQRSIPYLRDNMPMVAGLQWEPPIRLSRLTTLSHPLTDGQARTRLYGIDSSGYHDDIGAETSPERDCSCGFPSLVVAERAPLVPHVSVVYACEDMWASGEARNYLFHVVENAFDDEDTLNIAALDINGRSLLVTRKNHVHGDSLKSLARHGVPVVGAAAEGRRFYAWSADAMGIGVAAKMAGSPWLAGPQSIAEIPRPTIRWYYNPSDSLLWHDIEGGTARQPSLTSWSNIAHGNGDATLVWVESMTNPHVRYTRLAMGAGQAIQRYLPTFQAMQYVPGGPAPVPQDRTDDIAVVGAPAASEHAELPVVVRSLQPDSMFIHIRNQGDSVGRTYDYGHETVAWAEWVPNTGRARVRSNHLIDLGGDSGRELHYWYVNTTFSNSSSLFHPVIANAVVRMDTLTWQGYIDDSLHTYMDSLRINHGNISDSAMAINYNVLGAAGYQTLRNRNLEGQGAYWMGLTHFTPLMSQLITVRRMPGIPAPPTTIYHTTYLAGKGAWQHLSLRERDDRPRGIQGARRTS
jgi:hypothetical protein